MSVPLPSSEPSQHRLTTKLMGFDQAGRPVATLAIVERPLSLFLPGPEMVPMMTIGDVPRASPKDTEDGG